MNTEIIRMTEDELDEKGLKRAGRILRDGGLVAFPTETVYGLGGDALQPDSSRKIYAAKGRPSDNPLIVHISRLDALDKIAKRVPPAAGFLARAFWPGPLTMILEKSDVVPYETTGGLDTVAVRMPSHKIAMMLIDAAGGYVAAPSANTSGRPSPTTAGHVKEDLEGKIEMIVDGGPVGIGLESTIVDLTEKSPLILRPGYITVEMLEVVLGQEVLTDKAILDKDLGQAPKAPGMKYRHYAPKGRLTIVDGSQQAVTAAIRRLAREARMEGAKVGVICTDETAAFYEADVIESAGARTDEGAIAQHLYGILRQFDEEGVTVMYSEAFSEKGIGQAIMNRLLKAAGYRVLHV